MIHKISEIAIDTPMYRVYKDPFSLSLTDMFEIIIGKREIAESFVNWFKSDLMLFQRASITDFMNVPGIGLATAARLKTIPVLANRLVLATNTDKTIIQSPADAAALVQYEMSTLEQEVLRVLLLDTRSHVLDIVEVYRGSVNTTQIRVGEVFKDAIRRNAFSIIIIHNHPSGDPTPSPDDVAVTRAFIQAGKLLDVEVLDHLVIGQGRWVSLKERGLGFS